MLVVRIKCGELCFFNFANENNAHSSLSIKQPKQ